jgi:WD40 repeat protein
MELKKVKRLQHPDFSIKSSMFKEVSLVRITASLYCGADRSITLGLSNGRVMQMLPASEKQELTEGNAFLIKVYTEPNSHKGPITCLISEEINGNRYFITGSVDRTIKLWCFEGKHRNIRKTKDDKFKLDGFCPTIVTIGEPVVIQTLVGHSGTINALAYSFFTETLFSASNDKTIKCWKNEKRREAFFHPWLQQVQTLTDFSIKKTLKPVYCTYFDLKDKEKDQLVLLASDSEGSLHQIMFERKSSRILSESSVD